MRQQSNDKTIFGGVLVLIVGAAIGAFGFQIVEKLTLADKIEKATASAAQDFVDPSELDIDYKTWVASEADCSYSGGVFSHDFRGMSRDGVRHFVNTCSPRSARRHEVGYVRYVGTFKHAVVYEVFGTVDAKTGAKIGYWSTDVGQWSTSRFFGDVGGEEVISEVRKLSDPFSGFYTHVIDYSTFRDSDNLYVACTTRYEGFGYENSPLRSLRTVEFGSPCPTLAPEAI